MEKKAITLMERFLSDKVQSLLQRLVSSPKFPPKRVHIRNRANYALMTDVKLEEIKQRVLESARYFQAFVPVMEPRVDRGTVLSVDHEIKNFDTSNLVFTDTTFDVTHRERLVVVRETDGTLRTATPEEHDRMNRIYFPQQDKPVEEPAVFSNPQLKDALEREQHEFVLDWACYFFEPDDPRFHKIRQQVYDDLTATSKFHLLHHTRHFGALLFLACSERESDTVDKVLEYFGKEENLQGAADLIRLKHLINGGTATAGSDDRSVVEDYVENRDHSKELDGDAFPNVRKMFADCGSRPFDAQTVAVH